MSSTNQTPSEIQLLTINEASKELGISRSKLEERIERGEIRTIAVGNRRVIPRWLLRKWQETLTAVVTA